jgi:hypothetical protein
MQKEGQKEEGRKKRTDMLQGMLDLLILRTLRQGPLNSSRHYESHPDCLCPFGRMASAQFFSWPTPFCRKDTLIQIEYEYISCKPVFRYRSIVLS